MEYLIAVWDIRFYLDGSSFCVLSSAFVSQLFHLSNTFKFAAARILLQNWTFGNRCASHQTELDTYFSVFYGYEML